MLVDGQYRKPVGIEVDEPEGSWTTEAVTWRRSGQEMQKSSGGEVRVAFALRDL